MPPYEPASAIDIIYDNSQYNIVHKWMPYERSYIWAVEKDIKTSLAIATDAHELCSCEVKAWKQIQA